METDVRKPLALAVIVMVVGCVMLVVVTGIRADQREECARQRVAVMACMASQVCKPTVQDFAEIERCQEHGR